MVITIEFTSGRMCEYNTSTFCASDPWSETRAGRPVVACEFDLRLDLLMREGDLRLDVIRHALRPAEGERIELEEYSGRDERHPTLTVASRMPTTSILIASKAEMRNASVVYVSSAGAHKPVAWRQGTGEPGDAGWLINGVKFESVRRLYYSDAIMSSTSAAAVRLFRYLRNSLPDQVADADIAEVMGFPLESLEEVRRREAANAEAESVVTPGEAAAGGDGAAAGGSSQAEDLPATYDDNAPLVDTNEYADDAWDEDDE